MAKNQLQQRPAQGEIVNDEREVQDGGMGMMALNKSEIDMQITTAKRYPRSLQAFMEEATAMVTMTVEIAQECMYSLKRKGRDGEPDKVIEGPSARMAEIVMSAWGNCRGGARVIDEDDRFVTSQGAFFDLQRNVAITYEVRRRITTKNGHKFGDDMIGVTSNAACSIALRNAVFKGVPKAFWSEIYRAARTTAIGDAKTLQQRRTNMLDAFTKMSVSKEKVFEYLEVKGHEDITLEHLGLMIGVFNSIRDGETTIDDVFNPKPAGAGAAGRADDLEAKLKKDAEDKAKAEAGGGNAEGGNAPANAANNDVQTEDGPGLSEDGMTAYDVKIGEAGDEPTLNVVSDALTGDKTPTKEQRETILGWIAKRRVAVKTTTKKKGGQQKELGDQ